MFQIWCQVLLALCLLDDSSKQPFIPYFLRTLPHYTGWSNSTSIAPWSKLWITLAKLTIFADILQHSTFPTSELFVWFLKFRYLSIIPGSSTIYKNAVFSENQSYWHGTSAWTLPQISQIGKTFLGLIGACFGNAKNYLLVFKGGLNRPTITWVMTVLREKGQNGRNFDYWVLSERLLRLMFREFFNIAWITCMKFQHQIFSFARVIQSLHHGARVGPPW